VDLAPGAAAVLRPRVARGGTWLFPGRDGLMGHATVEHAFKRIAARAGLPDHLTPHSLRHTFAAMHLQRGASVYYVQRMLRHASIQITVDTYGSWLDPGRPELTAAMEAAALDIPAPPDADVSDFPVAGPHEAVQEAEPWPLTH
jgi:integrase